MNAMFLAVLAIAGSLFFLKLSPDKSYSTDSITIPNDTVGTKTTHEAPKKGAWDYNAIEWLLEAQSPNGGWGAGSHAYQNVKDPHQVQTDPATTSFAAMALLKAGGPLKSNPYKDQIMKALDRILNDVESRPNNGRITSLDGTQPQIKLGINIDASMALQFLTDIREQIEDEKLSDRIDKSAQECISLIQQSQNPDGGWAGGGWAPVLQSAMANNALERADGRYDVDKKAIEKSREYQAGNMSGGEVRAEDAAGVSLYAVASTQRATSAEAREAEKNLPASVMDEYSKGKVKEDVILKELESGGMDRDKAQRLTNSYAANKSSTKALQNDAIWEGFGNNGGEEYLSYLMTSEALAQQSKEDWSKWKQTIEPKFRQSQNPNGSWSGHHCITSPVFCTAAIVQAWHAGNL